MNRRKLLSMCGQAAIGLAAAPFGIKATEAHKCPRVVAGNAFTKPLPPNANLVSGLDSEKYIVEIVVGNYRNNGLIRQAVQQDREWGL